MDTGLSYMTRRRQGDKEVVGSWPGRLLTSLGNRYVIAAFHPWRTKWPAGDGRGHPLAANRQGRPPAAGRRPLTLAANGQGRPLAAGRRPLTLAARGQGRTGCLGVEP